MEIRFVSELKEEEIMIEGLQFKCNGISKENAGVWGCHERLADLRLEKRQDPSYVIHVSRF